MGVIGEHRMWFDESLKRIQSMSDHYFTRFDIFEPMQDAVTLSCMSEKLQTKNVESSCVPTMILKQM